MSQSASSKQSIVIGLLSGALILSIGIAAFLYFDSRKHQDGNFQKSENISQDVSKAENKISELPTQELAFDELFNGVANAQNMTFWFEQSFKEGTNQYHVKFFKSKNTGSENQSGLNVVGAITYKESAGSWQVVSKQEEFAEVSSFRISEKNPETLELSPSSTAILLSAEESGQGQEVIGKNLFVYNQNTWRDAGFVITEASNNGDCDSIPPSDSEVSDGLGPCWSYKGKISVIKGEKSDFPDLLVTRTGTESLEHRVSTRPVKNVTYFYRNGAYIHADESQ